MKEDVSKTNLLSKHPEIVNKLKMFIEECRNDIGDDLVGTEVKNCRSIGIVVDPVELTSYNPPHPYMIAIYDLLKGKWG